MGAISQVAALGVMCIVGGKSQLGGYQVEEVTVSLLALLASRRHF